MCYNYINARGIPEGKLQAATRSMSTEGDTMAFTPDDKKIIDLVVDGGGSTEASDDALIDELNKG